MSNDFNQASAFINALGASGSIVDFRAIHDQRKDIAAIPFRGTLEECWPSIVHYNGQGYGIFVVVAALDGQGRHLENVSAIRAHYVDLDNLSAEQNYQRAIAWDIAPSFAVQSSPGKYHVYWPSTPYRDNNRFQVIQRKLRQLFDGDKAVNDATRVMRLPGTFHCKGAPQLVRCWSLRGYGLVTQPELFEQALQHVNVVEGSGGRHDLGSPELVAPGLDWIEFALASVDPNSLERDEWISFTAAVKQSGWTLVQQEQQLFDMWSKWCAQYDGNDPGENLKQWSSIRQTEVGWPSIVRRVPTLMAMQKFKPLQMPGGVTPATPEAQPAPPADAVPPMPATETPGAPVTPPMPSPPPLDCTAEILSDGQQKQWFKGCVFVTKMGQILTPNGRFLNSTQFNGEYGGKKFIIDSVGKMVNEPWQAATRSTLWTVPKVDHIRFLPAAKPGDIIVDALGRKGVNTYMAANIERRPGDPSPFLNHLRALFPNDADFEMLIRYFAHNVKFPGFKIPWAPVIQSVEGAGKNQIKITIRHAIGAPYFYSPKADEMVNSGSKFNAWMRSRLFIMVDEIRVDERRDMIEILKPMISEEEIEIQAKGIDQDVEDNYSNWLFFSNYKDAIPINKNGRRFAIYYSIMQSAEDLLRAGMDQGYFDRLYAWLKIGGGKEIVADYLLNYPIERGEIPMRAPSTSSTVAAIKNSRTPLEQLISENVEDGSIGFRNGYISLTMILKRAKEAGMRPPSARTISTVLEAMGYHEIGRSPRPYIQEDANARSTLFHVVHGANVAGYASAQGYGEY